MKIYMDACCFNRPYDDLTLDRNYMEAEAVLSVISRCEQGEWVLLGSGAIEAEMENTSDAERLEQVYGIYATAAERVVTTKQAEERAAFFSNHGLKPFDSLHLALAELGGADVFLTTDDRLLRRAQSLNLKIAIFNPVSWLMEDLSDE